MSQGQLHHFRDLCQLLPAATNIVVAYSIQRVLLLFSLDWLAFAMDDSVRSDNAEWSWIGLDDLDKKNICLKSCGLSCNRALFSNRDPTNFIDIPVEVWELKASLFRLKQIPIKEYRRVRNYGAKICELRNVMGT